METGASGDIARGMTGTRKKERIFRVHLDRSVVPPSMLQQHEGMWHLCRDRERRYIPYAPSYVMLSESQLPIMPEATGVVVVEV